MPTGYDLSPSPVEQKASLDGTHPTVQIDSELYEFPTTGLAQAETTLGRNDQIGTESSCQLLQLNYGEVDHIEYQKLRCCTVRPLGKCLHQSRDFQVRQVEESQTMT